MGLGVVKALNPFHRFGGKYRNFLEIHLAKSRRVSEACGTSIPHVVTTSYLTHDAIAEALDCAAGYGYDGPVHLSRGRSVGLRMIPHVRDLRFAWEEMPQQILDEQAPESPRESAGRPDRLGREGRLRQRLYRQPAFSMPPSGGDTGFEVSNLLRNQTLLRLLEERPNLGYLMLHNIDTLGGGH